jgi:hypothetical protein
MQALVVQAKEAGRCWRRDHAGFGYVQGLDRLFPYFRGMRLVWGRIGDMLFAFWKARVEQKGEKKEGDTGGCVCAGLKMEYDAGLGAIRRMYVVF